MRDSSTNAFTRSYSTRFLLSVALGLAFVLRMVAILLASDLSSKSVIWEYGEQAQCALEHGTDLCRTYPFGDGVFPTAYVPPLLGYMWLALFHLFGDGVVARAVWLAASLLAALASVALTFYLCRKLVPSRTVAFVAACLMAAYPTFVFVSSTYHQTNWAILFLLAITAIAVKLSEGANPWRYGAIGGILCGLSALNRSEMLVIGPVLMAIGAIWPRNIQRVLKAGLASVITLVIVLAPWTIRNYELFGEVIPTAQSQGYNLWKGYNPYTSGSGNEGEDPTGPGGAAVIRIRDSVPPGPGYETRVQTAYIDAFKADIRDSSVGRLTKLVLNKVAMMWVFDWTDHQVTGGVAYRIPWLVTNVFAIAGLILAWRNRRKIAKAPAWIYVAAVCLLTAAYAITSVLARYRMNLEPFIFMMAAVGVVGVWARIRGNGWRLPDDSDNTTLESTST
jgi:4-amino-4-deoxy-L-arabinose transferase-like glycosyltransferase